MKKKQRKITRFVCPKCNKENYFSSKKKADQTALQRKKYCPQCQERSLHLEKWKK